MNDATDGMTIFNCGFKCQNATHADSVKEYEVWLNNLVQQYIGIGQFCTTDDVHNC